jgi:hypothetical protein
MSVSVVKTDKQKKKCKPFILDVMVMNPEEKYKFQVQVEKFCTADNDPMWKLVFDLYKKKEDGFIQIVHVSYKPTGGEETNGVAKMVTDGVSKPQAKALTDNVFPAAKAIESAPVPTPEQEAALNSAMSSVARA